MSDLLQRCIEAATHAPSRHNAKPWRFEIVDGVVELHAEGARATPETDPDGRELVVACGAALYALRLAMRCEGSEPVTAFFPEGEEFSVLAKVAAGGRMAPSLDELALRAAIDVRHADPSPLDGDAMAPDVPLLLQAAAESEGARLRLLPPDGPGRPMVAVLWTDTDRPLDWLRAGMALEAVLLRATVAEVSASFVHEPVDAGEKPGFVQAVLRFGVSARVASGF